MPDPEITALLRQASQGDETARERLLASVYMELRRLARLAMRDERREHTLEPTALVHEAYMRLLGSASIDWVDRYHFFFTAARTMRRILKDDARAVKSKKRFGGLRIDLSDATFPYLRRMQPGGRFRPPPGAIHLHLRTSQAESYCRA
jgi:RNA polymerase sigma-70 factor, ECF subfamily